MSKINTGYSLNECPPMKETILYSIQQIIVAVFNVIPVPLLIGAGIGLSPSEITILVAGCLLVTGIALTAIVLSLLLKENKTDDIQKGDEE